MLLLPLSNLLCKGDTDINLNFTTKAAMRQTIIDEFFHSHMHEIAVQKSMERQGVGEEEIKQLDQIPISFRSLNTAQLNVSEQ